MQATQLFNKLIKIVQTKLLSGMANVRVLDSEFLDNTAGINWVQLKKRLYKISINDHFTLLRSSVRFKIAPHTVLDFSLLNQINQNGRLNKMDNSVEHTCCGQKLGQPLLEFIQNFIHGSWNANK